MATSKRKPAPAAKKKAGPAKSGAAKKPTPKKSAPAKKVAAPKKALPRKPVKAAATKKAAPRKGTAVKPLRSAAVVKPQRPAKKIPAATKTVKPAAHGRSANSSSTKQTAAKQTSAKSLPAKKPAPAPAKAAPVKSVPVKAAPAKPAVAVKTILPAGKPVSPKHDVSTKRKMASTAIATPETVTREDGRYALPNTVVIDLPANYKPASNEEYMGPRQLAYFRAKLQKWREDLVEESKQTIDNLRDEVRDVGDEAERATRETENSLELRTRDRYRKLIGKIDKALKRIEEGRYGYCEETDEEIGIERLEARPIATLSLDAQERWEHRQKQMGD
jgi:DnaK suppressor protein